MSWASFVTNIQWFKTGDTWAGPPAVPLSDTDKTKILNTLQLLYNSSPTAQAVMERSIAKPLHLGGIDPANINPGLSSKSGDFSLFNISKLEQFHYFNKQGFYVLEKLGLSLIHEFIHSVDDKDDLINSPPSESNLNQPNYDQAGQVLPIQNQIAQEMGWTSNFQVSYQGAFSPGEAMTSDLQEGVSYSENNIVDTVRIGALTNNNNTGVADNLDHSRNTTHVNDLFLAWDGADAVYGGAGNDYIYGGRGEDRLFGGTGNDLLHGGDLTLVEAQDGYDVADYSKVSSIQSATGGIVANFDYAAQNLYLGSRYVVVENDGTGGVDRLVSIEKVVGTSFLDTFKIKGSLDAQLSLLVDGTLGGDIVDATASNAAYSFVSRGGSGLSVEDKGSGGTIKFKNIDGEIKGGAGADYFAIKDLKVHGGDGADYIIVAGTEVFGDGGGDKIELNNSSPEATVTGGAGNDAYIVNAPAGRATLLFGAGDGHDVVVSYTDNSVLIDFGNVSLSSLSVLWNRKYVSSSSGSIEWGDGTIPVGSDHYNGKAAIALPTGDTIAIGDIEGSFSWTGNNPAAWEQIRFLGEFRVRGAEGEVNFEQLARMTGLLEPNKSIGKVLPSLSAASNHSADSQWAAAYFSGQSTPTTSSSPGSPLGATAGNDTFMGNEFSHTVSYSAAAAAVSVDLGIYGRQQTNGSGLDQLIGVTDIVGSAFGDVLQAADVGSSLAGGGGNDILRGGDGYDYLDGGDGDDSLWAAGYFDWIDGGAGYDTLVLGGARENFTFQWQADGSIWIVDASGEEGEDGLVNVEAVWFDTPSLWQSITDVAGEFGSEASELVTGSLYVDWLWGLGEDDELYGRAGDDRLDGGDGYDQAVYDGASTNFIALRNADGTISVQDFVGGEGHDTLINIEAVYFRGDEAWTSIEDLVGYYGTSGNDTWVAGTARADNLYGLEGDDELIGFEGDDHLFGGDGDDQANFYGLSTNYVFTLNPDGTVTATDTTGAEGVDVLDSIEYVYFVEDEVWTTVADLLGSSARGSSAARVPVLATADSDAFDAADFAPFATTVPVVANEAWFA